MNNNDLRGLGVSLQQPAQVQPGEFDATRKARQDALSIAREVLGRAAKGSKVSKKELIKAIKALHTYSTYTDKVVGNLMKDFIRMIQIVAQYEVSLFAIRTNVKTLVKALADKGIVAEDELRRIHDEEIMPQELKQMGISEQTEEPSQDTGPQYGPGQTPT